MDCRVSAPHQGARRRQGVIAVSVVCLAVFSRFVFVVQVTNKAQTVYVYKCDNAVIIIEGKVNSIAVDGCKKTGIVFDECIATCEVLNSSSVQVD